MPEPNTSRRVIQIADEVIANLEHILASKATEDEWKIISVDGGAIEALAFSLEELGRNADSRRIRSAHEDYVAAVMFFGLSGAAEKMPAEKREAMREILGPRSFSLPVSDGRRQKELQKNRRRIVLGTLYQTLEYLRQLRVSLDTIAEKSSQSEDGVSAQGLSAFVPADTLEHDEGIRPQRLSEAARSGKVETRPAPAGMLDSGGKRVKVLYHREQAVMYCKPKHVKKKTRRTALRGM